MNYTARRGNAALKPQISTWGCIAGIDSQNLMKFSRHMAIQRRVETLRSWHGLTPNSNEVFVGKSKAKTGAVG